MLNRRAFPTITMQSFAQDRGTGATPAGAKARAIQDTFTTSDAIPWKPRRSQAPWTDDIRGVGECVALMEAAS
jgi:hypothetical protein